MIFSLSAPNSGFSSTSFIVRISVSLSYLYSISPPTSFVHRYDPLNIFMVVLLHHNPQNVLFKFFLVNFPVSVSFYDAIWILKRFYNHLLCYFIKRHPFPSVEGNLSFRHWPQLPFLSNSQIFS